MLPTNSDERRSVAQQAGHRAVAGVVLAVVGFSSSFVIVLAGLRSVGASPGQAASGLLVLCLTQAAGMAYLSWRHRTPISLAWSTPGAALLVSTGTVEGGWAAAVGAFVACGALIVLTGLVPALGRLISLIPTPIARAMLAGVLVPICLAPVTALVDSPGSVAPVVLTWAVMLRLARRWAVPSALAVALLVVVIEAGSTVPRAALVPTLTLTTPGWSWAALASIALPLYVVTMASQNVPGVAVLRSFDYETPWRPAMTVTGIGTVVGAPFGGHAINLAAITAALAAGPEGGPDRTRRWQVPVVAAGCYVLLGLGAAALTALVEAAPAGVIQAAAGLALLATLGAALGDALAAPDGREATVATFVIAASGVTIAGIGAAFWALVAGLILYRVMARELSAQPAPSQASTGGR